MNTIDNKDTLVQIYDILNQQRSFSLEFTTEKGEKITLQKETQEDGRKIGFNG